MKTTHPTHHLATSETAGQGIQIEYGSLKRTRAVFDIPPSTARLLEEQGKIKFARVPLGGKGKRNHVLVNFNSIREFLAACESPKGLDSLPHSA